MHDRRPFIPTALLAALLFTAVACDPGAAHDPSIPAPAALLDYVPSGVLGVAVGDSAFVTSTINEASLFAEHPDRAAALALDLHGLISERYGVLPGGSASMAGWMNTDGEVGLFIAGPVVGTITSPDTTVAGRPALDLGDGFYVAQVEGGFVAGGRDVIEAACGVLGGNGMGLSASGDPNEQRMVELLGAVPSGGGAIAVRGDLVPVSQIDPSAPPVRAAVLNVDGESWSVRLSLDDEASASRLGDTLNGMVGMMQAQLESAAREARADGEFIEAYAAVSSEHTMRLVSEELLTIAAEGRDVRVVLDIGGSAGTVAIIGMGAAIAVPAFLRYTQRSRTVEATMNVRRLYDSSISYFDSDHTTPRGDILPAQFPASIPRTPAEIPCGERRAPNQADWTHDTWEALNFEVQDPHYYAYQFDSSGTRYNATFTASAFGDLDCDGIVSTFVRVGSVDRGNFIRGGAGLYQRRELE